MTELVVSFFLQFSCFLPHFTDESTNIITSPTTYQLTLLNTNQYTGYYRYSEQGSVSDQFLILNFQQKPSKPKNFCLNTKHKIFDIENLKPLWFSLEYTWYPRTHPTQNNLLSHSWYKYGTCMNMSQCEYFNKSIELYNVIVQEKLLNNCKNKRECYFLFDESFKTMNISNPQNFTDIYIIESFKNTLDMDISKGLIGGGVSLLAIITFLYYRKLTSNKEQDFEITNSNSESRIKVSYEYPSDISIQEKQALSLQLMDKLKERGLVCESMIGSWILAKGNTKKILELIKDETTSKTNSRPIRIQPQENYSSIETITTTNENSS